MTGTDFDRRLGARISHQRRSMGLSQSDLADQLASTHGLPFYQQTVLKVEKGDRPLRAQELYALASIFGLTGGELTQDL